MYFIEEWTFLTKIKNQKESHVSDLSSSGLTWSELKCADVHFKSVSLPNVTQQLMRCKQNFNEGKNRTSPTIRTDIISKFLNPIFFPIPPCPSAH